MSSSISVKQFAGKDLHEMEELHYHYKIHHANVFKGLWAVLFTIICVNHIYNFLHLQNNSNICG